MKKVSFKVAKAIKDAGYPQSTRPQSCYDENGKFYGDGGNYLRRTTYDAPTYIEVWLWLWREKKIEIELVNDGVGLTSQIRIQGRPDFFNSDPEEAIVAAIEYLVENDLIN